MTSIDRQYFLYKMKAKPKLAIRRKRKAKPADFFGVMPRLTKFAFLFFVLAKMAGMMAICIMFLSRVAAAILFVGAWLFLIASVSYAAAELFRE